MLSWLFPMVLLSPVLYFASSKNTAERRGFLCTSGEISALFTVYKMIESVPFYFIPLIRIIILNSWIMHSLRKADRVLKEHGQRNATRHKRNKRIMKMLILIIVIFSYGWIPFGYVFLFIESLLRDLPSNIFDNIYVSCRFIPPVLSTCLNPIIIFSFSTNYRQALRNCLRVFLSNANNGLTLTELMGLKSMLNFQKYLDSRANKTINVQYFGNLFM